MRYKTIILELIQQNESLHNELRRSGSLLVTVDQLAVELKADHETYLSQMVSLEPTESRTGVSQRAFEMALKDMEERLLAMTPAAAAGSKTSPGE